MSLTMLDYGWAGVGEVHLDLWGSTLSQGQEGGAQLCGQRSSEDRKSAVLVWAAREPARPHPPGLRGDLGEPVPAAACLLAVDAWGSSQHLGWQVEGSGVTCNPGSD